MKIIKAVFTDLDGTLIKTKTGRDFPLHTGDWRLVDETLDALEYYIKLGYKVIVVTNQAGIEQGYVPEKAFVIKINTICDKVEKELNLPKGSVSYYYCKHNESYYRKPNPGMAYDAAIEYEINLKESIMFGDMDTDREFALNSGIGEYKDINEILVTKWSD
jgi:D-glycero-D-manno-heptose 1,7-bisphosphate phosphatase